MLSRVTWLLAAMLCAVAAAASQQERCGECRCQVVAQQVLALNCSGVGELRHPDAATLRRFQHDTVAAEFEGNDITSLARLSLANVSQLSLAHNQLAVLGAGVFKRLSTLKTLRLSYNYLHSLHGKAFQGLKNLEQLDLSHNQLARVDATVFAELKSLRTLSLAHNHVQAVEGGAFAGTALQALDLSWNALDRIDRSALEGLGVLQNLSLAHNNLSAVDNFLLGGLGSLGDLDLSWNSIGRLEPSSLSGLQSLRTLSLAHNLLAELPPLPAGILSLFLGNNLLKGLGDPVRKLSGLKELMVEGNKLEDIAAVAKQLQSLKQLELLDLSNNQLTRLDAEAFRELRALTTLSLAGNLLSRLEGELFASTALESLDLSWNALEQVAAGALAGLGGLRHLSLARNRLPAVDAALLAGLASLERLDLSHNSLARLEPGALAGLAALRRLRLDHNLLQDLPELPAGLAALSLGGNRLQELGGSLGKLQQLLELGVEGNQLRRLDISSAQLQVLNVSRNLLSELSLRGFPQLQVLDLSDNQLTSVPADVTGSVLPQLRWLSLDNNPVRSLVFPAPASPSEEREGESFRYLAFVSVSRLDELTELTEGAFAGLASPCGNCVDDSGEVEGAEMAGLALECSRRLALRVTHNPRLTKVHPDAFTNVGACSLNLSHNALSSLERGNLEWESLQRVDLQNNPWACTCALQWVLDIIVPRALNSTPELLHELRCASPAGLRGMRLVHFYHPTMPRGLCGQSQRLMVEEESSEGVTLNMSGGMLAVVIGTATVAMLLVVAGIFLQRKYRGRHRIRNRRF